METDSGKDTNRLIKNQWGRLATSSRPSLAGVFVDDETHAKGNRVSEVARIAIKARVKILLLDPIDVVLAKAQRGAHEPHLR